MSLHLRHPMIIQHGKPLQKFHIGLRWNKHSWLISIELDLLFGAWTLYLIIYHFPKQRVTKFFDVMQ